MSASLVQHTPGCLRQHPSGLSRFVSAPMSPWSGTHAEERNFSRKCDKNLLGATMDPISALI
eukprot:9810665-Lingulodinium_polyedra.AAC.1